VEEQVNLSLPGKRRIFPGAGVVPSRAGITSVILSFLVILISLQSVSADETKPFTPENILSFTEYLVEKGEYYRAAAELKRLESFYPGYLPSDKIRITGLYLEYKSGRFNEVISSGLEYDGCPSYIFMIDSYIGLRDYQAGSAFLEKTACGCDDEFFSDMFARRKVYLSLVTDNATDPLTGGTMSALAGYGELAAYSRGLHDEKCSPVLAGLLGIVPGLGYAYAGDPSTGAVAFTVIGICGAVSYASFENGVNPLGIIAGAVGFFFYGGNIMGGYLQAQRYNKAIMDRLDARLVNELAMDRDADRIYLRFGIGSHGR